MITTQVSEVPLGEASRHETSPSFHKRARTSPPERATFSVRCRDYDDGSASDYATAIAALPPVPEMPPSNPYTAGTSSVKDARAFANTDAHARGGGGTRGNYAPPRAASPTPSHASSSTFSAATTSATTLSSRASLSSCRSSFTSTSYTSSAYYDGGNCRSNSRVSRRGNSNASSSASPYPSSRRSFSSSRPTTSGGGGGADYFPMPSSSWGGDSSGPIRRRRGLGDGRRDSGRGGRSSRERNPCPPPGRRLGGKDYASEASSRKRNRSCSRERAGGGSSRSCTGGRAAEVGCSGVECARCLEWCRRDGVHKKPITRTLQMDYWVRTPRCKAAKSKHIDFIDDVAYSREQFIEETVFTCPFTGERRDIVLERNMFPYDVPTDVEHWTLWSRKDLANDAMEAFVQGWAADNHPHVVEWECDNNEGERSIDWFHVHVFFRLGCEDKTGVPRDPTSAYDGPCRRRDEAKTGEGEKGYDVGVVVSGGGDSSSDGEIEGSSAVVVADCE